LIIIWKDWPLCLSVWQKPISSWKPPSINFSVKKSTSLNTSFRKEASLPTSDVSLVWHRITVGITGFSDIARPLHMLKSKWQPLVWEEAQETAFRTLKEHLIATSILASPKDEKEYILDTNASLFDLGAVLQQRKKGEIRVNAYTSGTLSRAERNYSTTRRELLAAIFGFK
jgi:RNase H-like domain found in reverse transcriptase